MEQPEQRTPGTPRLAIKLVVNGSEQQLEVGANETLLQTLRTHIGLIGPKYGCGIGYCGACTVLVDDQVAHSCCLLAGTLSGKTIDTVEGPDRGASLDEIQTAMLREGALQCGYCTPGIVTTLRGLMNAHPDPDEQLVREWLGGNICRCTGFESIVRAALSVRGAEVGTGRDEEHDRNV